MKTPGWFKRGAATTAIFLFVGSAVAGVLLSLMMAGVEGLTPSSGEARTGYATWLAGLLGGMLLQAGPALAVGLGMSFASPRIRSDRGWIAWAFLINAILVTALIALIVQVSGRDMDVFLKVFIVTVVALPCALSGVVSAAATLGVRPRPSSKLTVEVFA